MTSKQERVFWHHARDPRHVPVQRTSDYCPLTHISVGVPVESDDAITSSARSDLNQAEKIIHVNCVLRWRYNCPKLSGADSLTRVKEVERG